MRLRASKITTGQAKLAEQQTNTRQVSTRQLDNRPERIPIALAMGSLEVDEVLLDCNPPQPRPG